MKFSITALLTFFSWAAFVNSPALGIDDELLARERKNLTVERRDLEDFLNKQNYPAAFNSLRASLPATCSDEAIISHLITSNKYKKSWSELGSEDQIWVITKIKLEAERISLDDFITKKKCSETFLQLNRDGNTDSNEERVQLLVSNNGYPNWDRLDPHNRKWVIDKVVSQAEKKDLNEFLSQQNYSEAFLQLKRDGNQASTEELVMFLLVSNRYPNWERLSPPSRIWVVDKIRSEAARKDLEERLSKQDYRKAFLEIRKAGNKASDFGIAQFLVESNGYQDWGALNYHDKQWATAQVRPRAKKIHFEGADPSLNLMPVDPDVAHATRLLPTKQEGYAQIFRINQNAIEKGYKTRSGKVFDPSLFEISRFFNNVCKRNHEDLTPPTYTMKYQTVFRVTDEDSFVAAQALVEAGLNPSVSNAANAVLRGGGVKEGAQAQEEEICKRSTLYNGLLPELYPMADDELIYTPSVTVFMSPGDYSFMDEPFTASVITQAYPCLSPTLVEPEKQPWYQTITESKVRAHLRLAAEMGHDSLVLAASGCGVFAGGRSGPVSEVVAQIYARLFAREFKGVFREVRFAILRGGVINRAFERYIDPLNEMN